MAMNSYIWPTEWFTYRAKQAESNIVSGKDKYQQVLNREKEVNEKDESIRTPRVGDRVHLLATQKNSEENEDKKENADDVHFHRWDDFCLLPKQPTIIPVVLEFYSNLKLATHDRVYVKRKCIDVSLATICEYCGMSSYEEEDLSPLDLTFY
ncbi:hypothetical protein Goshw_023668 [Gossypium schwendimanii]|uniref:Uncharacterized protein n=1 Tax=Gossypium schwendimanii TaxID=34291 RepID=A0A7J9MPE9_GOSSC|nr:hypothetical protein [Gossypium schwendimanii]